MFQQEIWLLQYEYLQIYLSAIHICGEMLIIIYFWNSFEIICGLGLQVSQLRNQLYFMIRGVEAPREDTWKSSAQPDDWYILP